MCSGLFREQDVERARAMGAEFDRLLDVGGARRSGDEVERRRHGRDAGEYVLKARQDQPAFKKDDLATRAIMPGG